MKTILITAYAVNPYKGSEDGTGWNMSYQVARENKVIVITRENNQQEIERYLTEFPDPVYNNMSFEYFDLPKWAMWWKKKIGERGYVLYYYLWQLFMPLFIIKRKLSFDIVHCLNFHSDSHPHFLWIFKKPTLWGPVGHHPKVPKLFLKKNYGKGVRIKDSIYQTVKWCMRRLDPFYHLAAHFSDKVFVINSAVPKAMKLKKEKAIYLPAVATKVPQHVNHINDKTFNILSVGRFTYMKGFDVAINAFNAFMDKVDTDKRSSIIFKLVGKGEDENLLKKLIEKSSYKEHIKIIPWVTLDEMKNLYSEANIFLFPSHEGAGMVVPEAMSYGIPVVCFDNEGPGELLGDAGIKIPYSDSYSAMTTAFGDALHNIFEDQGLCQNLSSKGKKRYLETFTWEHKGKVINNAYLEA